MSAYESTNIPMMESSLSISSLSITLLEITSFCVSLVALFHPFASRATISYSGSAGLLILRIRIPSLLGSQENFLGPYTGQVF